MEELMTEIRDLLFKMTGKEKELAAEIINKMQLSMDGRNNGKEMISHGPDHSFYRSLLTNHPGLTASELKLAALVKADFTIKEIASTLVMKPESVKVSRSRLRKKLGLQSGKNLKAYLMTID